MKNLDLIGEELFNKIRGRFPSVTIGNQEGVVTNVPSEARFFDFDFKEGDKNLGKVSVSVDDKSLSVMYSNNFVEGQDKFTKEKWYGFLKELRYFAKKRLLNFDTRDITKSNLNRRDYKFLANNTGDTTMSESKMYGTSKTSYQDVGSARLALRHSKPVNQELAHGRTQHVEAIYIESDQGERFKYPYRHLNGARAMARHVAEGGNAYDDFGKYIVSLSEELNKLRKFKNYMGRSGVMAEGLQGYMDVVYERIDTVKKTIEQLQKPTHYKTAFEGFEKPVLEDVPDEVASNWIDQLTIRQFNEELKDVFPYIYKLVNEKTKAKELGPEDLLGESHYPHEDNFQELYGIDDIALYKEMADDAQDMEMHEFHDTYSSVIDMADEFWEDHQDEDNDDGQPSSYDEYQDLYGGDDWDHGQYDFESFESWADDVVESGLESEPEEGNKFTQALKKARDDDEDEMEVDGEKIPVTEFVLSLFDRETGQFPKGETAVLTAIEKDYGEQYINPAKQFIERIMSTYEKYTHPVETLTPTDDEWSKTLQIPNRETWEKLIKQAKAKGDKEMLGKLMAMGDQIASTEGTVMEPTIGQEEAKELEDTMQEDHVGTYTVQQGDTMFSIAKRFMQNELKGMDVEEAIQHIAEINNIDDPSKIQPGMKLEIGYTIGGIDGDPTTGEPITRGIPQHDGTDESSELDDLKRMAGLAI